MRDLKTGSGLRWSDEDMKMNKPKNIGIDVKAPEKECNDVNCPFHGNLKTRGRIFEGIVVSDKMRLSAVVEWERRVFIRKYERYDKKRTKLHAHNPACIEAKNGEKVKIMECRPLSKTKTFVIVEKIEEKATSK